MVLFSIAIDAISAPIAALYNFFKRDLDKYHLKQLCQTHEGKLKTKREELDSLKAKNKTVDKIVL